MIQSWHQRSESGSSYDSPDRDALRLTRSLSENLKGHGDTTTSIKFATDSDSESESYSERLRLGVKLEEPA